jgi:flagellar biosynthesis/type III secretory pathway chaperone
MNYITVDDVVRKRQAELTEEFNQLKMQEQELNNKLALLERRLAEIEVEYKVFEEADRRELHTPGQGLHSFNARRQDKLQFEDVLRKVFENAGRPLTVKELISQLEHFGYTWSKYNTAYAYLTNHELVNKAARGYYQLNRVW